MYPMSKKIVCTDVYGGKHEVPVDSLQWRPAVYAIVIKDGAVLLLKTFGDKYALPGGGLDLGENPEDGVVRETKEETGLVVDQPKLIDLETSFFQSAHSEEDESYHSLLMYYSCSLVGGEISNDGFDEDEKKHAVGAEWVPLDDLDKIQIVSTVDYRPLIEQVVSA